MDRIETIVADRKPLRIVYILISDIEDYFAEEAFLSINSLLRHNPDSEITIITDKITYKYLQDKNKILNIFNIDYKVIEVPNEYSKRLRSRYLKTNLRKIMSGDFLYLDTDTLILQPVNKIFNNNGDISAVFESHRDDEGIYQLNKYVKLTSSSKSEFGKYFNSGVMFVKDTPAAHKLYSDWHNLWLKDVHKNDWYRDQPSLAKAELLNHGVIKEMPGKFNCQIMSFQAKLHDLAPYMFILDDIHIFHYFNKRREESSFPMKHERFWKELRKNGMNDKIQKMIENPLIFYYRDWLLESTRKDADKDLNLSIQIPDGKTKTSVLKKLQAYFRFLIKNEDCLRAYKR